MITLVVTTSTVDQVRKKTRHNMLRWNDDGGFTSWIDKSNGSTRQLQAFTNETADYEDGPTVNQDRVVNFEYCFGALQRADSNTDGRIERSEYLYFVQDFGQNTECLGDLLSLPAMPIELTACWNQLSCECRYRGGAADCCSVENANIPINGVNAIFPAPSGQTEPQPPEEMYIEDEQNFLNQTCLRTDQCIISYCGYPPPPIPPVPPPVPLPASPTSLPTSIIIKDEGNAENDPSLFWLLLLLPLLCCCRRRFYLCPAATCGDDSDDEEKEDTNDAEQAPNLLLPGEPTVMRNLPVDNEDNIGIVPDADDTPDNFGDYNDPNANRMAMKSMASSEVGGGGGVRYYRVVKEPLYEEPPPPPEPKVIDQYEKGVSSSEGMKLKHVQKEVPLPSKEDPYALEHYEPDGGIVVRERTGKWSYEADGGYTSGERAARDETEWKHPDYKRAAAAAVVATDNRRDRNLGRYGGGAIFDHLDETDVPPSKVGGADPLQWVFSKTLNTLDDYQDDLLSEPSASQRSLHG